jgi:hypothetical protein
MLDTLHTYVQTGMLRSQRHPSLPLTIFNYSAQCQYRQAWDDVTLQCRGLVVDDDGNVVARPLGKFFNWEENRHTPSDDFVVYEKLDGCLGILFFYEGEWVFASRGSFTSPHAQAFEEIARDWNMDLLDPRVTYCFEILHPDLRIVLDYGSEPRAVMLAAFVTETGEELDIYGLYSHAFTCVKVYEGLSGQALEALSSMNTEGHEGFVIRYSNGTRVKVKFADYVALHKVVTNLSTRTVWEELMNNNGSLSDSFLNSIPDEHYEWVRGVADDLANKYDNIMMHHVVRARMLRVQYPEQRDFAAAVMARKDSYVTGWLFSLDSGRDIREAVWQSIRPEFAKVGA